MSEVSQSSRSTFAGKKICMVAPYFPKLGGMAVQVHLMVDGLEREHAEVLRVDTILHKLDTKLGFPLRILLQPFVTAIRFLRTAPKCDVVHVHAASWWGFVPVMVCAPLNCLFARKRLVISFHGGAGHLWLKQYSRLVLPFFRMADRTVVVSSALKDVFKHYGVETEVLRNLVNLDRFPFRQRDDLTGKIVWIRSFENTYDPLTALAVFERVKKEIPDATITFIGSGSLRSEMDAFISEHKLTGVRFAGRLKNSEVHEEFDKADILLNTSRNDGLPTALLEASASGLPIVSTAVGGISSMMVNGVEGILVSPDNIDAMACAVVALVRDHKRAAEISAAARNNAERYTWDRCANELAKLYAFTEAE